MAGTLNDIYRYNFNGLTIPWPKLRQPRIDWDTQFLSTGVIQETIKFYYPKEWDSLIDGLSIKHRYSEEADSLAEGVKDIIDGYAYQFSMANGVRSHAEGVGTVANNLAEHAEGKYNVSHTVNSINSCNTIHSIGIGNNELDRKNAVEVMHNGDVYITGVGNYDGRDTQCQNENVKTLQEVIEELEQGSVVDVKGYVWDEEYNSFAEGEPLSDTDTTQPISIGERSHAEGYGTTSTGGGSHAEGFTESDGIIEATDNGSHAEGHADGGMITSNSHGSHAGGNAVGNGSSIEASSNGSFAHGMTENGGSINASGDGSAAFGYTNNGTITAEDSGAVVVGHASGYRTYLESDDSGAFVNGCAEVDDTGVTGYTQILAAKGAHGEGYVLNEGTINASGDGSHAQGKAINGGEIQADSTTGIQDLDYQSDIDSPGGSHAEGFTDGGIIQASGTGSHAEGYAESGEKIEASGTGSHAEGRGTVASGDYAHAEGWNAASSTTEHNTINLIGYMKNSCSISSDKKCDMFFSVDDFNAELQKDYYDSDEIRTHENLSIIGSTLTMPSTGVSYAAAYSDIAGKEVTIITATWTDTETDNISFKDIQVSYVGSGGTTKTVNLTSVFADSRNYDTETYVPITLSMTYGSGGAMGIASHSEGYSTIADGEYSHAEGDSTYAHGFAAHAEGSACKATAPYSHAGGFGTVANEWCNTSIGKFNKNAEHGDLFIIGNGADSDNRSNAFVVNENGNVYAAGAYYAASDERKKNVIDSIPLDKAYELVNKCQTVFYTWKNRNDNYKKQEVGLLAQEVEKYFPELVQKDNSGYLSLDYSKLTVILMTVIKDLTERVSKMGALEERLKKLEDKLN